MNAETRILITLGIVLLLGLATDAAGRFTRLPRVTLLLLLGFAVGPSGLNMLPAYGEQAFTLAADIALVMVGFLLGGTLTAAAFREYGSTVLAIGAAKVAATVAVVAAGLTVMGLPLETALILAAIATATAPAATADVVREGHAKGSFARILLGIVAVDDAMGLVVFSAVMTVAAFLAGTGEPGPLLLHGVWEIGGALILGVALGIPGAYLTGRIKPGEPTLVEALGLVFLCGGLALWLGVSFILAAMVLGAVIANFAGHHTRPFHAIEGIEWPFMIVFFVFAGASLEPKALLAMGGVGTAYCLLRAVGIITGSWAGAVATGADGRIRRWMGLALMPQAGVALGMALVAADALPEAGAVIVPVTIGATVIFEFFGPVLTGLALRRADGGEPSAG